jgi:hypothetical protein
MAGGVRLVQSGLGHVVIRRVGTGGLHLGAVCLDICARSCRVCKGEGAAQGGDRQCEGDDE